MIISRIILGGFCRKEAGFCYCHDIAGLFAALGYPYREEDWRLFIDVGKSSLKGVLLHNGNEQPSIPIVYARNKPESYESLAKLLNLIEYGVVNQEWMICADFKVINILCGMKGGYPRHACFLCLWRSRQYKLHWQQTAQDCPMRTDETNCEKTSVIAEPLVPVEKILLPPLHIKLGLMSQFVKALFKQHPDSSAFKHLNKVFNGVLSEAKIKAGVFVGPQIRLLRKDKVFEELLSEIPCALEAWLSFGSVCDSFLGNHRSENFADRVEQLLDSYEAFGCNMSLKVHMLHRHLDFFAPKLGDVTDESGERFHQDIAFFEKRFNESYDVNMLGDYLWTLVRETDPNSYRRKGTTSLYFKTFSQ